jgi:hypothetical protein
VTALLAIETVVIALLALLVTGLLRSHADILRRLHELEAGGSAANTATPVALSTHATAADVVGVTPDGDAIAVGVAGTGHDTLLAFLSSSCRTCAVFWDALAAGGATDLPANVRLVVVTHAPESESPAAIAALAPDGLPCVMSNEAVAAYRVPGLPYFALVDGTTGRVGGEGTGVTWPQVLDLLTRADADLRTPTGDALIDDELSAAGIGPGDRRLYPSAIEDPRPGLRSPSSASPSRSWPASGRAGRPEASRCWPASPRSASGDGDDDGGARRPPTHWPARPGAQPSVSSRARSASCLTRSSIRRAPRCWRRPRSAPCRP